LARELTAFYKPTTPINQSINQSRASYFHRAGRLTIQKLTKYG